METKRMILCENGKEKDDFLGRDTYKGGEERPLETLALCVLHLQTNISVKGKPCSRC